MGYPLQAQRAPVCRGYCPSVLEADWHQGTARRAILDVSRSRFPIQVRPLLRLLRSLTATGILDTDPLSTIDHIVPNEKLVEDRGLCARAVFAFFDELNE